ncbi:hypothetical protein E4T38_06462 [Aureobasidium subglaciale]|nr:hypothetical protein E4T38_06462 [Aureobasidium subglaciale]KAI5219300.1 hypothetical protein E4T40_06484 [Aureobasidium subglaciale]KAI5223015.1 hypothetical protein E4T41_06324 [Aureobasidium subglaciale]KAI5260353.1 hypothetical protein E4T46_06114 [Aureobasidium subglaciale]
MAKKFSDTADYHSEQASYLDGTTVRGSRFGSKGLFATKDIAVGAIILCERAFTVSNTPDDSHELSVIINPTNNVGMHGSLAAIWIDAVRKSFHNPSSSLKLLDLYDGTARSVQSESTSEATSDHQSLPLIIDGMPVIDVFRLQNIIEQNGFGFEADKDRARLDVQKVVKVDSPGVWVQAARMNHSCLSKSSRGFIGNFIIVRATKSIRRGEEITTMYCPVDGDFDKLKQRLGTAGFACSCKLCEAENEYGDGRSSLMFKVSQFLGAHPLKHIIPTAAKNELHVGYLDEALDLEKRLKQSYPLDLFATKIPMTKKFIEMLPTMGMAGIHEWLMFAHSCSPQRALDYANFVLLDHDYRVLIDRTRGIKLDRTNCILSMKAVLAMQYIEHFYAQTKNETVAASARALAEEMHTTYNGSMGSYSGLEK